MTDKERKLCLGLLKLFKIDGVSVDQLATEGQIDIFFAIISRKWDRVQIESSTQYGKSLFIALGCIILSCIEGELIPIIAPTNSKASIIMRYYVQHLSDHYLFYSQLEKDTNIEKLQMETTKDRIVLKNKGGIYTLSVQAGNTKKGFESAMGEGARVVIQDESALIPDDIEATIFRMIAGKKDAIYIKIGNPFYHNHFYKSSRDPNYHKIFIDYRQGIAEGRYSFAFIEEARKKPFFSILYECLFPPEDMTDASGYTRLFPDSLLERCVRPEITPYGEKRLGCDIAEGGGDFNAFVLRTANVAKVSSKFQSADTMQTTGQIVLTGKENEVYDHNWFIDSLGVGKGVNDRLREQKYKPFAVKFSEQAFDPQQFLNQRAECYWLAYKWLSEGGTLEPHNDWEQLSWIRYKVNSQGKIQIISKEDLRKEGYGSPDCFIAGTMIETPKGKIPIEKLVEGDEVITPFGNRKVIIKWEIETNKLVEVKLSNGQTLIGKPNHKILTKRGFISLDTLLPTDIIEVRNNLSTLLWKIKKLLFIKERSIGLRKQADIFMPIFTMAGVRQQEKKNHYIIEFGKIIMAIGKFLMDIASTILIRIPATIILKTWSWLNPMNINEIICWNDLMIRNLRNCLIDNFALSVPLPLYGINQKRGENGIGNIQNNNGIILKQSVENVLSAEKNLRDTTKIKDFAVGAVCQKKSGKASHTILTKGFAYSVKKNLWGIGIGLQNVVVESVRFITDSKRKVYNLTLDKDNVYYANGVLVENCADAFVSTFARKSVLNQSLEERREQKELLKNFDSFRNKPRKFA